MNILNGLRKAWITLNENKKNNNGDIVYSEDNDLIEKKLDEIIKALCERDYSDKSILRDFVYDISNRESMIYPNGKRRCWKYSLVINKEDGTHHFELSIDGKKVMIVDATTTLKGYLLGFNAMYQSDISEYLGSSANRGTTMIKIECPKDGIVTFEDKIYSLDILNNNYSNEMLENSIVSEYQASLSEGRGRK